MPYVDVRSPAHVTPNIRSDIWRGYRTVVRCLDRRTLAAAVLSAVAAGLIPLAAGTLMAAIAQGMTIGAVAVPLSLLILAFVTTGGCLAFGLRRAYQSGSQVDGDKHDGAWKDLAMCPQGKGAVWHRQEVVGRIFRQDFARLGWAAESLRMLYGLGLTIIAVFVLLYVDAFLGAVALLGALGCVIACLLLVRRGVLLFDQVLSAQARVTRCLVEYLSALLKVLTSGVREPALAGLRDVMSREASTRRRAARLSSLLQVVPFAMAAVLVFVASETAAFIERPNDLAYFVEVVLGIANLTIGLLCFVRSLTGVSSAITRLKGAADDETRRQHEIDLSGRIAVTGASYRAAGLTRPILQSIDLDIEPGTLLGIAGPSGGGKSTLIKLLAGLLSANEGEVRYDGVPIEEIAQESRYKQVGIALHDQLPDDASVYENIAGFTGASREQVAAAAELSGFSTEVARFPQGMGTEVGPWGSLLSAGQRQRMMLARALVTDPGIVFVDDALSALDVAAARDLLDRLRKAGKTLVVSSQRPGVLRGADCVVVLDDGVVTARGSFDSVFGSKAGGVAFPQDLKC